MADYVLAGVRDRDTGVGGEANENLDWLLSLPELPELDGAEVAALCNLYQFGLLGALENLSRWATRLTLSRGIQSRLTRLAAADPDHAGWQRDLWVSYWRMAAILDTGSPEARSWWQRAYDTLCTIERAGPAPPWPEGRSRPFSAAGGLRPGIYVG